MEWSDFIAIWIVLAVLIVYVFGVLVFFLLHLCYAYFGKTMQNRFLGSRIDPKHGVWHTIHVALTMAVIWPHLLFWKLT